MVLITLGVLLHLSGFKWLDTNATDIDFVQIQLLSLVSPAD